MNATYRILTDADAEAFRDLRQRSLTDHPDIYTSTAAEWGLDIETYRTRIRENRIMGAFVEGALAGTILIALAARPRQKQRHKVEFWSVYVAPELRGRGIASGMLAAAIREAERLGYEGVVLGVASHNTPALRLYEAAGFVCYGTERGFLKLPDGRYVDECLMEKRLA